MHRIPHSKKSFPDKRSVIYLQHGILASSADWVLPGPRKGFAYILADFGYDVLMSNVRGTRYSRKHTYLDLERHSLEFWDFSWHQTGALYNVLNTYEFLPRNEFLAQLGDTLCNDNSRFQILCTNTLFAICGFNEKQMNSSLLPIIMGHTPSGASTKQIYHCAPGVKSGKFQRWDYGWVSNLDCYGDTSPPNYNLRSIYAPVYLFYSKMIGWCINRCTEILLAYFNKE
ncbi:hypothetical protein ILUMI_01428 [Ignelater luminosus]|uniref:Partial AB-hydrolase lipase domain-containing protein n=1 Tax=Ignelater luminosus TaxID=2038154 RepID=A0A8K0DK14_IGNLU|nr:hypothetical protein ILUMI_01428 [Ignelater luminosus]